MLFWECGCPCLLPLLPLLLLLGGTRSWGLRTPRNHCAQASLATPAAAAAAAAAAAGWDVLQGATLLLLSQRGWPYVDVLAPVCLLPAP
jgi:hypothetical protein